MNTYVDDAQFDQLPMRSELLLPGLATMDSDSRAYTAIVVGIFPLPDYADRKTSDGLIMRFDYRESWVVMELWGLVDGQILFREACSIDFSTADLIHEIMQDVEFDVDRIEQGSYLNGEVKRLGDSAHHSGFLNLFSFQIIESSLRDVMPSKHLEDLLFRLRQAGEVVKGSVVSVRPSTP